MQSLENVIDYSEFFNDSYERISKDPDVFYDIFCQLFVENSLEIKKSFSGVDVKFQKSALHQSVVYLIMFFATKRADDHLVKLAKIHRYKLRIKPEMYELWMDSLLETLKSLDNKFDRNVEMAWRITLSPGIEFMKHYSNE